MNADEIAKGLSSFQPETVAFEAGRIMLYRIRELLKAKVDFAFETTLSTKSYRSLIKEAKEEGYKIVLIFFWLESVELAKQRVNDRVTKGGHNIPDDVIGRRYIRGLKNLREFIILSDQWTVCDNSKGEPSIIAEGNGSVGIDVYNEDIWNVIKMYDTERD